MSRCRAPYVSSRVLVARAIDLPAPWLAAIVPLVPNAATASLEPARTSIGPAEGCAGSIIWRPTCDDHEPAQQQLLQ